MGVVRRPGSVYSGTEVEKKKFVDCQKICWHGNWFKFKIRIFPVKENDELTNGKGDNLLI